MSRVDPNYLANLHGQTDRIRNFCILAHVDHGKTTLSDSLVCSNGVISPKLAGKIRFLDSTEDEQQRGITMHSSAISLLFQLEDRRGGGAPAGAEGDGAAAAPPPPPPPEEYLINLVDSPGHIDFSSDVSTATRLCDGALIVIDVLEGLCTQTHAVLFKALKERMRPCIVLNKIDRLALEMKLTPSEAFTHLRRIVENVNALAFTLLTSELRLRTERQASAAASSSSASTGSATDADAVADAAVPSTDTNDADDPLMGEWTFSPEKGNVIFASALDCWGFGLARFANMWAKKLGVNKNVLQKHMFEDFAFNAKTKKLVRCDPLDPSSQPMFATMVLEPLWQLYDAAVTQQNPEKAAKMAARGVGVDLPPREISPRDPRATAQAIFRRWLPLSDAVLRMVVRCMPSPDKAQRARLFTLVSGVQEGQDRPTTQLLREHPPPTGGGRNESAVEAVRARVDATKASIARCSTDAAADLVVFVSKMVPVRVTDLSAQDVAMLKAARERRRAEANAGVDSPAAPAGPADDEPTEVMVALARVFSGVLRRDCNLYIIGHRHDPVGAVSTGPGGDAGDLQSPLDLEGELPACFAADPAAGPSSATSVTRVPPGSFGVYICLGPSVHPVGEVAAGNIVGIVGLEGLVLKTATLASTWACEPMRAITFQAKPMVCVAVEPLLHQNLPRLEAGLQSLYQFDPVVEVGVDDSGQHTMTCLGELHLEQCLKTLVERFTKCEVRTSEPLVAYREAVLPCTPPFSPAQLPPPWGDLPGLSDAVGGRVRLVSSGGGLAITVRCFPLPAEVTSLMDGDSAGAASLAEFLALRNLLVGADGTDGPAVSGSDADADADDEQLLSLLKTHKPLAGTFWAALTHALFTATTTDGTAPGAASEALAPVDAALLGSMADKVDKVRSSNGGATSSSSSSSGGGGGGGGGSEKDDNDMYRHRLAAQLLRRLVAVGPKNCGPNLLVLAADAALEVWSGPVVTSAEADDADGADGGPRSTLLCRAPSVGSGGTSAAGVFRRVWTRLQSAVAAGFQIISGHGPLMHEPLHGVGFVVEKVCATRSIVGTAASDEELALIADRTGAGPGGGGGGNGSAPAAAAAPDASGGSSAGAGGGLLIGQLISDVTESLRLAVLSCPVRVVEPVYACDLQCDQSQLGNLYAVLSKRRGHVHKEDIIDGTTLFLLSAHLPVAESFGFAQELLKRTSGNGTAPQLQFSHWQCLDDDPFWRPTTAEELEDHGEWAAGGDKDHHHNLARTSIDRVRKRKGLPVEEKIVVFAEKQRTLNKKK